MSASNTDVSALFQLLESNDRRTVEEVKALIHENLDTSRETLILFSLVDYYIQTNSQGSVDILIGIRDPHSKALLDKLNDYLHGATRLQVLTLLGYIVRKQPSWLHIITQHTILNNIMRLLKQDTDIAVLMSACLIVTTLLPVVPVAIGPHLQDIFQIFTRLAGYTIKKTINVPDVFVIHLQMCVYSMFHRLYGMYPCSFLAFLRQFYSRKENMIVFDQIIKPMLERVRVHPLLITGSKDMEVSTKRWKRMEIHDIVIECAKLSLDMIEGTMEADNRPILPMYKHGVFSISKKILSFTAPNTPRAPAGQEQSFFSSHFPQSDIHYHQNIIQLPETVPVEPGTLMAESGSDAWTPSHARGLDTPPPCNMSQMLADSSDLALRKIGPCQVSDTALGDSTASASNSVMNTVSGLIQEQSKKKSQGKVNRSRRQTIPVVLSKSMSVDTKPGEDIVTSSLREPVKRRSLEESVSTRRSIDEMRTKSLTDETIESSEKLLDSDRTSMLTKSDSLGLLTGGYRSDDKSGSRTPQSGTQAIRNQMVTDGAPIQKASTDGLSDKSVADSAARRRQTFSKSEALTLDNGNKIMAQTSTDYNVSSGHVSPDVRVDHTNSFGQEQLTAHSVAMFISRYTSNTSSEPKPTESEDKLRKRSSSMPTMSGLNEDIAIKDINDVSMSSTDIPSSRHKDSIEKTQSAKPEGSKFPYEDLFPNALPYAPITQCQRCFDRAYAVPDFSAPTDVHQSQKPPTRVLGSEIPLFATFTPGELLDRHLISSADYHQNESEAHTENVTVTSGSAPTESEHVPQTVLLHSQLMYERHRREQHAVRNRRLFGKLTHTAALEEQSKAANEQLMLQQSEINFLRTALESLRYEYNDYKDRHQELMHAQQEQVRALRREKEDIQYTITDLESTLETNRRDHQNLLNEFKTLKSDSFTIRQELIVAKKRLSKHDELVEEVRRLNKETTLMGELHKKYQERLNAIQVQRVHQADFDSVTGLYKTEITVLKRSKEILSVQLDATNSRLSELEDILVQKERSLANQKRLVDQCKTKYEHQLEAVNSRVRSLQNIIGRLETEILDIYSRLQQERHDEKSLLAKQNSLKNEQNRSTTSESSTGPISINRSTENITQFSPDISSSLTPDKQESSSSSIVNTNGSLSPTIDNRNLANNEDCPKHISASIPVSQNQLPTFPSVRNHSYPTRRQLLTMDFDYSVWGEMEMTSSSDHRPEQIEYDHHVIRESDTLIAAPARATSGAGVVEANLADSGVHESKSE